MSTATSELSILVTLKDQASAAMKQMSGNFDQAVSASKKFGLGLAAAATAVGGFGIMAVKSAADMEQTQIAFETMLGSAEKAKSFYADLVNFAARTPFELKGLEQSSKQLLAYGFTQNEVLPNLKALGDIAAGVGMDKLPNLIMAFGQVKAATKLTGMELRQFTEAGVPLLDMLAKQLGKPVSAIQDMVSAGEVGFPAVQQAMQSLTGEGGRFNNLMDKQAKSLGGMWSNLQDAWEQFLRGQGAQLLDWGKKFVTMLIDLVQNKLPPLIQKTQEIVEWFGKHKEAIYIVAGAILGGLVPAIYAAALAFGALASVLLPYMIGGAIIGGLVAGIVWIVKNYEMLKQKIEDIWNGIKQFFSVIWDAIKTVFEFGIAVITGIVVGLFNAMGIDIVGIFENIKTVLVGAWDAIKTIVSAGWNWLIDSFREFTKPIQDAWKNMWNGVSGIVEQIWEAAKNTMKGGINWIIEKINGLIEKINSVAKTGADILHISAPQIPKIPLLAAGGIVTKPTLAMIGEAGPEAVIPLSHGPAYAGIGGITINITGNTFMSDRRAAEKIGDMIFDKLKLNLKL